MCSVLPNVSVHGTCDTTPMERELAIYFVERLTLRLSVTGSTKFLDLPYGLSKSVLASGIARDQEPVPSRGEAMLSWQEPMARFIVGAGSLYEAGR